MLLHGFMEKKYRSQIEYVINHLSFGYFILEEYTRLVLQGMIGMSDIIV